MAGTVAASVVMVARFDTPLVDEPPVTKNTGEKPDSELAQYQREAGASGDAARREFQRMDKGAIAVLSRVADASWSSSMRLGPGARLTAGRFVLESGAVQMEFLSGANLVIEAPADIELISTMSVFCRHGKVRARVPSQAHGFTIETPTHRAIDLGTEFAVDVGGKGSTEVHVVEGEVKLQDKPRAADKLRTANKADRQLLLGDAFRGQGGGQGASIKVDAARFIDAERLIQLSEQDALVRYMKWREWSRQIAAHPDIVTYFAFEDHSRSERILRQDGPLEGDSYAGAIVGCRWIEGRWSMKQALEFKGVEDRVRVNIPGEYRSISLACWIRIEGFDRFLSSLLLPEGHDLGEVHWQFTDTGKLLLGVKTDSEHSQDYFSDVALRPTDVGRWVHLACVYNQDAGSVSHYVDGQRVSTEAIRKHVTLRFGASELGNWVPEAYQHHRVRNLNGRMDEFALFKKALSDEEIRTLFEAGKPSS
ncbi:MAG: FecR domain-containing protein [Pirellulales bacterium]|nr:FecR domain-containing protein [Pirellulales bacterium]